MPDCGTPQDLAHYRLEKARGLLTTSAAMIQFGDAASAVNRQYYAVFNAVRAVLALTQTSFKKHSGTLSYFQSTYIKTGIFPNSMSDTLVHLFRLRNEADYSDYEEISLEDALRYQDHAQIFVRQVVEYLNNRL